MIKNIKTYFLIVCLGFFIQIVFVNKVYAVPVGGILKSFKGIEKIFKKGSDELPDLSKKIDELKNSKNIDESNIESTNILNDVSNSQSSDQISLLGANKISKLKKSKIEDVLNDHGLNNVDQIIDSVDIEDFFDNKEESISAFRIIFWLGRIFRVGDIFNTPKTEDRLVIRCNTDKDEFYFTAILEKKKKWLLLSGNFISNQELNKKISEIKKQNLYVLIDNDEYIIFSTQTENDKKFPSHYFIISKNGYFVHEKNIYGTESPNYIIVNASSKIEKTNFFCNKI